MRLATSSCNLPKASPCQRVSVANPNSRSLAPNHQRSRSADNGNDSALVRACQFLTILCEIELSLRCTFCRPHLPKVFRLALFNMLKRTLSSCYSPVHFLSTTFADRTPHPWKQRPYFPEARNKKKQGFAHESFHPQIHVFPSRYSSLLLPHANCSCSLCYWHDDAHMKMTVWHDDKTALGHSPGTRKLSN